MSNDFDRQKEIGETAEAFVKHHFSFLTQDFDSICLLKEKGQKIEGDDVEFVPLFPTECETLEKGGKRKFKGYKIDVNAGDWEKAEIKAVGKVLARDNDLKLNKDFKAHGTIGIEIWRQPFDKGGKNPKQAKWMDTELEPGWLYDFLYPEDRKSKRGVKAATPDLLIYVLHDETEGKDPFKKPPFAVLCFKWDDLCHRLICNNILPFPIRDKTKYPRWTDWQGKSWKCQRQPKTDKACMIGNMLHVSLEEIIDLAAVTMVGEGMPELSPDRQEVGFSRYQFIKKNAYGITTELSERDKELYSE